jgi:hypothetical protein
MYKIIENFLFSIWLKVILGPKGLSEKNIRKALCISISVCQTLREQGMKLPRGENTIPGYVMGLFDPTDPLLGDLKAVGFSIIEDKRFEEFYNKPRTLAFFKLT